MLGLMGFSGSLPLYVIHRYYIFVFIDRANKDACLLIWRKFTPMTMPLEKPFFVFQDLLKTASWLS